MEIFHCPEESRFYAFCLEMLLLDASPSPPPKLIVEFGSGNGEPVINAIIRTGFEGFIHGFEINRQACEMANLAAEDRRVNDRYVVSNSCFFKHAAGMEADCLIANPPYLPAPDAEGLHLPALHGGRDGSTVSKNLLSLGYRRILVLISSFSNPLSLIGHALDKGYKASSFLISPLPFGQYSSQPKVKDAIHQLKRDGMAFYSQNVYLLAGVLFTKQHDHVVDLSSELMQAMKSINYTR